MISPTSDFTEEQETKIGQVADVSNVSRIQSQEVLSSVNWDTNAACSKLMEMDPAPEATPNAQPWTQLLTATPHLETSSMRCPSAGTGTPLANTGILSSPSTLEDKLKSTSLGCAAGLIA